MLTIQWLPGSVLFSDLGPRGPISHLPHRQPQSQTTDCNSMNTKADWSPVPVLRSRRPQVRFLYRLPVFQGKTWGRQVQQTQVDPLCGVSFATRTATVCAGCASDLSHSGDWSFILAWVRSQGGPWGTVQCVPVPSPSSQPRCSLPRMWRGPSGCPSTRPGASCASTAPFSLAGNCVGPKPGLIDTSGRVGTGVGHA